MTGPEWTLSLSPDRARRGTVARLSLFAPEIEQASEVAIAGTGVAVRRDVEPGRGQLHLVITIAVDASLGWRDLELSFGKERRRLPSVFQILDFASSGGRGEWPGIGGHLI